VVVVDRSENMLLALAALGSAVATPVLYGYDVVAYFSLEEDAHGVAGSEDFQYNLTSTDDSGDSNPYDPFVSTFWFSTQENLDTFAANPTKYTPEWGGY